jgi:hypothetical protein
MALSIQAELAKKKAEAETLRAQLLQVREEVDTCRRTLEASGMTCHASSSLVPAHMQAGKDHSDDKQLELRHLLQWLAKNVDLSQHVVFDCGGKGLMQVGSKNVNMHRMVAWQLPCSQDLKLSVPIELQAEVVPLLAESQSRGHFPESLVQHFADGWELVNAEVASAPGIAEPAMFLVCCATSQAIVCARWPLLDFNGPARVYNRRLFNPDQHFCGLAANPDLIDVADNTSRSSYQWATGDRVEVEWEGEWFTGVLQWVHGDVANVKCDVDEPGVTTDAAIRNVRPARDSTLRPPSSSREMCSGSSLRSKCHGGHMRARSIG